MNAVTGFGMTMLTLLRDVLPIILILFAFQLLVLRRPVRKPAQVSVGLILTVVGLALFLEGLDLVLFPIGRLMAEQLTAPGFVYGEHATLPEYADWTRYYWVYVFAAAVGFASTIAEPALIAVAIKASQVSGGIIGVNGLRFAVAIGVAAGVALGNIAHRNRHTTALVYYYWLSAGYHANIFCTEEHHTAGV